MSTLTLEEQALFDQAGGDLDTLLDGPKADEPAAPAAPEAKTQTPAPQAQPEAKPAEQPAAQPAAQPAEAKAEPEPTKPAEVEDIPDRVAILPAPDVSRADEQFRAIQAEKAKLEEKFDNGEIDAKEFRRSLDELNRNETALIVRVEQAQFAAQANVDNTEASWKQLVAEFRGANAELKDANSELAQEWDRQVRMLAALKENESKSMNWFLREAHRRAKILVPTQAGKANPTPDDRRTVEPPRTLADVPAASPSDTNGVDEFAAIDRLSGIEQERAFARLTEDQKTRYLSR